MLRRFGRPAAGVDAGELVGLRVPHQSKQVAARPVHHGFHDAQDRIGGDGGIHGRTAARQNLRAGLRRQCLRGGDDAARRDHHGAGLRTILRIRERRNQEEQPTELTYRHGPFILPEFVTTYAPKPPSVK